MDCPPPERLQRLLESTARSHEREHVLEHAETCESCRGVLVAWYRDRAPREPDIERDARVGRYEIVRLLGAGAMGVVYVARDPELDRDVAIKLLRGDVQQQRLYREAQAAAKLAHPNVVTVHDVGIHLDRVFVTMELIRGVTLRGWLEQPRSWRDTVAVAIQAGRGLAAVHAAGLVHRDIKPDNIFVGEDGRVRIGDFGLVRSSGSDASPKRVAETIGGVDTEARTFVGTPAYAAPEQLRGDPADQRSDQFAFAVTVWEALFGRRPFVGTTFEDLVRRIERGPDAPPGRAPARLVDTLRRALALSPAERFASVEEMLEALARVGARVDRRSIALAAAFSVAVAVSLVAVLARPRASPPATSCPELTDARSPWSTEARRRLEAAFAASGHPLAAARARAVSAMVDRAAARWRERVVEVCRAKAASTIVVACLNGRRTELADAIAALTNPDADAVEWAARANLAGVARCGAALDSTTPPPPAVAAEVTTIRRDLARVSLATSLHGPAREHAALVDLVARASRLDYQPLLAQAHLVAAEAATLGGDAFFLVRELRAVRDAAERGHDEQLRAEATVRLIGALVATGELSAAERASTSIEPLRAGGDMDAALVVEIARGRARLALARAQPADAVRSLAQAVDVAERGALAPPVVAEILGELAGAVEGTDRAEAEGARRRAEAIWLAHDSNDLARLLAVARRAAAAGNHRGAFELARRIIGRDDASPEAHRILAASAARWHDWTTARAGYRRAALLAPDMASRDLSAAASAAQRRGDVAAALVDARAALAASTRPEDEIAARLALGRALVLDGDLAGAGRMLLAASDVDLAEANFARGLARRAFAELSARRPGADHAASRLVARADDDLDPFGACLRRPSSRALTMSTGGHLGLITIATSHLDGTIAGSLAETPIAGTWSALTGELSFERTVNLGYIQRWRANLGPGVLQGWFVEEVQGTEIPNRFAFDLACRFVLVTPDLRVPFEVTSLTDEGVFTASLGDDEVTGRWDHLTKRLTFARRKAAAGETWDGTWTGGLTFAGTRHMGSTTTPWTIQPSVP